MVRPSHPLLDASVVDLFSWIPVSGAGRDFTFFSGPLMPVPFTRDVRFHE